MFSGKSVNYMVAVGLLTFSAVAISAENSVWYVGVGAGSTEMDVGIKDLTGGAALDDTDTGFKLFVGKKIKVAGVPGVGSVGYEGFYVNFGESTLTGDNGDGFSEDGVGYSFTANNVSVKFEGQAFGAGGILYFPVTDQASVRAKVGLARWDFEATLSAPAVGSFATDEDGIDFYFGIGASYQLGTNFAVGLDYERYTLSNGLDDVDFISGAVQYSF